MAIFRMNFTGSKGAAKANIRYIQHRPGGKTEQNHLTHSIHLTHCCTLAEISNPEHVWYCKTYHDLTCQIYSPEYQIERWSSPFPYKFRKKVSQKDTAVPIPPSTGDNSTAPATGKGSKRITRTLFGWDGAMERQDAYRMVDEAEGGSSYFRIKISPDPKTEDTKRDLSLQEVTEITMQTFEERIRKPVHWVAAEHDDHTPIRHVHILAIARGRVNREDLQAIMQTATRACLAQRRALDRAGEQAREQEEAAWERSV